MDGTVDSAWLDLAEWAAGSREMPLPSANALCERAALICREAAKEDLAGLPLYVVPVSRFRERLRRVRCGGFTSANLSERLREFPEYCGAGPAFVINDLYLFGQMRNVAKLLVADGLLWRLEIMEFCRAFVERSFVEIAIHEMAHIIRDGYFGRPPTAAADLTSSPRRVDAPCSGALAPASAPGVCGAASRGRRALEDERTVRHFARYWETAGVPWQDHDYQFTRCALHLRFRASMLGIEVAPRCAGAGPFYAMSPIEDYIEALGSEPQDSIGSTIHDVLRTAPPNEFLCLFGMDALVRYEKEKERHPGRFWNGRRWAKRRSKLACRT